jgi:hypothetical protein
VSLCELPISLLAETLNCFPLFFSSAPGFTIYTWSFPSPVSRPTLSHWWIGLAAVAESGLFATRAVIAFAIRV